MKEFLELNNYRASQHEKDAWFPPPYKDGETETTIKIVTWSDKIRAVAMIKFRTSLGPNSAAVEIYIGDSQTKCIKAIIAYQVEVTRRKLMGVQHIC